ncbi:hypothetical protein KIN20_004038, partial [Parelaphostrongylus tenuis]
AAEVLKMLVEIHGEKKAAERGRHSQFVNGVVRAENSAVRAGRILEQSCQTTSTA